MSDTAGISPSELSNAISNLRSELRAEFREGLNAVRRELHDEINRLEEEMKQVGEMIVRAIEVQTLEVIGGVAANTAVVEAAKLRMEEEFSRTLSKLDTQIESTLQIEVGKKVAEANAIRDKMVAFVGDVRSRFDRSIITSAQNRELYNVAFRNLTDEYSVKIRSIGAHIFQVRLDDIAPAVKAAAVPYEEVHSLPIEMDLRRLEIRSACLDETLTLLKSSRLDEVLVSVDTLDAQLEAASTNAALPTAAPTVSRASSRRRTGPSRFRAGLSAATIYDGLDVSLARGPRASRSFNSDRSEDYWSTRLSGERFRSLVADESAALLSAARSLHERRLISDDALALFNDFVHSDSLQYLET